MIDEFLVSSKGQHIRTADLLRAIAASVRRLRECQLGEAFRGAEQLALKIERLAATQDASEQRDAA